MPKTLDQSILRMFTGTEQWHRWSVLFPKMLLTDGAKYVAEQAGAYWLMDAIASHQPKLLKIPACVDFQVWTLKINDDGTATLTCVPDSDKPVAVTQEIPFTDFPKEGIVLWCLPMDQTMRTILLPSEY